MADELTVEGKQYVSSKRAAQLSHYAQDYVGQLARGGHIDAQRIGGLWYVQMDSLLKYKDKADSYVPKPPQQIVTPVASDALVSFDGKDYVSASRASEITGYHQDYVGQLARSGKVLSRQIGNRWYVDRDGLLKHKEEKDRLLGAVQAKSVGIPVVETEDESYKRKIEAMEPLSYTTDTGAPLMPAMRDQKRRPIWREESQEETALPIRVIESRSNRITDNKPPKKHTRGKVRSPRIAIFYIVGTVFVFSVLGAAAMKLTRVPFLPANDTTKSAIDRGASTTDSRVAPAPIRILGDFLEPYVTKELVYKKFN